MKKNLKEMSLEELWKLFPIILVKHNPLWANWFLNEKGNINNILKLDNIRISHIGSTAIPFICSKPIVDVLVEIDDDINMEYIKEKLENNGYICMNEEQNRYSFNKGYTKNGYDKKVFHIHVRYFFDNDELYFRDYLLDDKVVANNYENLKLSLWKKYEHDRDGYTLAKSDFIKKYTVLAKEKYKDRYNKLIK